MLGVGSAAKWIGRKGSQSSARVAMKAGGRIPSKGQMLTGAAVGAAFTAGVASETLNPAGYAGDITEDLTGHRDFAAQTFGASIRNNFTSNQYRMGRPGRRRPQAPPGDIVFGMYNLR